ncbi:RPC10 subunit of RNA polymerases I, II, and III, putative [Babesia caballi]|uniref:RPC10 subunit of RNA polymerases I, II, and III, putative n=1 Tax=Babesia caballi TaxID=5871 RepID=A0AAV4LPD2_BABCB|nr:RPC10 subunit of RNA polymerases I, II, and III, putative [Babesia caballi]
MTKLSETQEQVERLKKLVEKFLACDDDELLSHYEEYQEFKALLSGLLPTVAKYRIQLGATDAQKVIFGPKTRQIVEQVVRHYDKVYEIDEEQLAERFVEVEQVNAILAKQTAESLSKEEHGISILEETKEDLRRIELAKELRKKDSNTIQANLSNICDEDIATADAFGCVLQVYKNYPAESLEDILVRLHSEGPDAFLQVLGGVVNLITQISKRPDELSLRLLRVNNEQLYEDIIRHRWAVALLKYARFKIKHSDEIKETLAQLGSGELSDEYFLYLHEPDMFGDYGAWKAWIDFIGETSSILEKFVHHYKSLMRLSKPVDSTIVMEALSQARSALVKAP